MEETKLALATHNAETDAVVTAQSLPALTGNGPDDLLCGSCGEVLAKGLTPEAIARTFDTQRRLLLQCMCGAYNLIREAGGKAGAASGGNAA